MLTKSDSPQDEKEESFEVVDERGRVIGAARRSECHANPGLAHRVSHVLVFDSSDSLLLQKRAPTKDIQPGKWDTSVGGHLKMGESHEQCAVREGLEEIGVELEHLRPLYDYIWRSNRETEVVRTFLVRCDGPFRRNEKEITELRFWAPGEVAGALESAAGESFTPNLKHELRMLAQAGEALPEDWRTLGALLENRPAAQDWDVEPADYS